MSGWNLRKKNPYSKIKRENFSINYLPLWKIMSFHKILERNSYSSTKKEHKNVTEKGKLMLCVFISK